MVRRLSVEINIYLRLNFGLGVGSLHWLCCCSLWGIPYGADGLDCTLNACCKAVTEVFVTTGCRRLSANGLEEKFDPQMAVNLANADRPHSWVLVVKSVEAACHHRSVGSPRGICTGHLLSQQGLGLLAEPEEPVVKVNGIGASGAGCTGEFGGHNFESVSSDYHRDGCGYRCIWLKGAAGLPDCWWLAKLWVLRLEYLQHAGLQERELWKRGCST